MTLPVTDVEVPTPHGPARVALQVPDAVAGLLVLGHGVGGGIEAPDLLAAARRNAGFSVSDSARALISRFPTDSSLAHDGTRPQRIARSERSTADGSGVPESSRGCRSTTPGTVRVGATLYSGTSRPPSVASRASNSSARSAGSLARA